MGNIDDKDLQDVSGGGGQIKDLDGGGDGGSTDEARGETPTPGPGGGSDDPTGQGGSGGTTEMGPG